MRFRYEKLPLLEFLSYQTYKWLHIHGLSRAVIYVDLFDKFLLKQNRVYIEYELRWNKY